MSDKTGEQMIDLQSFCGTDATRWYLCKPFSWGNFSYVTDGCIMLRLARCGDIPAIDDRAPALNFNAPLDPDCGIPFSINNLLLPPAPTAKGECQACRGRGTDHDCPECECVCDRCNGQGDLEVERRISTTLNGEFYSLRYIRLISTLPGFKVAEGVTAMMAPLQFRFDGGIGALMPLHGGPHDTHIDIEIGTEPLDGKTHEQFPEARA